VTRRLIVALLAAVALLAGCGEDNNDAVAATSTTAAIVDGAVASAEVDFIGQVNALCVEQQKAIGGLIGPLFSGEPTPEAMQDALDGVVELSRQLADDIGALTAPPDLGDEVTTLVDALDAGTDEAASRTGVQFFGGEDDPWAKAAALAGEYGMTACSGHGG
jgi:hypothetical protein